MRKGKSVIGQGILSYNEGAKVGSVKDLLIGMNNDRVVALLVEEGGLLSSPKVVPFEFVTSFGKDAVVMTDLKGIIAVDNYPEADEILARNDKLLDKKVFTETGEDYGKITDVFFSEQGGRVVGYEVSGGLIENVKSGTSYLPLEDIVNIGPDVILIRPDAGDALDAQVGGIQGAVQQAGDKLGSAATQAKDKAGEVAGNVREAASAATQSPEQAVIGKRAAQTVETNTGRIIVATGQRIRQEHLQQAQQEDKQAELYAAAGVGQAQAAGAQAGATLQQAGDNVGQVAGQAADTAQDWWHTFTAKISQITDASGKKVDEERTKQRLSTIQDAVGRPVTKVILDRQDNVILNLGDIITHEAVQRSYDAGMLDSMLENVYKGEVEFSKEEMRAPVEAEATVDKASGQAQVVDDLEQKVDQLKQERQDVMAQPATAYKEQQDQQSGQGQDGQPQDQQDQQTQQSQGGSQGGNGQEQQEQQEQQSAKQSQGSKQSQQKSAPQMNASDGGSGGTLAATETETHEQASIPNEQFHQGA
ncbi:MAG TPA: PRC-barrel domain-containing protein [Chloroflexia bacterium]|jgi:uncharacterized protein YrrD